MRECCISLKIDRRAVDVPAVLPAIAVAPAAARWRRGVPAVDVPAVVPAIAVALAAVRWRRGAVVDCGTNGMTGGLAACGRGALPAWLFRAGAAAPITILDVAVVAVLIQPTSPIIITLPVAAER